MKPFQERVITEKAELDDKISKLRKFVDTSNSVYCGLPVTLQNLLAEQLQVMIRYSNLLDFRIQEWQA